MGCDTASIYTVLCIYIVLFTQLYYFFLLQSIVLSIYYLLSPLGSHCSTIFFSIFTKQFQGRCFFPPLFTFLQRYWFYFQIVDLIYSFFIIRFQKINVSLHMEKNNFCFTAPIIITLIPPCKRNCIDTFLCILTTAKSLTSVGMHTVVTFSFDNSNLETMYQVTKMSLQIHGIIIQTYRSLGIQYLCTYKKKGSVENGKAGIRGFLHFLLDLLTWLQTRTARQSVVNFYGQPQILPEISKDVKT